MNPFTKAQWEKIIACVSTPSSSPPFPPFDRVALLMVVNQYLENMKKVELEPATRIEHWKKSRPRRRSCAPWCAASTT
jgi:hypothetical protein